MMISKGTIDESKSTHTSSFFNIDPSVLFVDESMVSRKLYAQCGLEVLNHRRACSGRPAMINRASARMIWGSPCQPKSSSFSIEVGVLSSPI